MRIDVPGRARRLVAVAAVVLAAVVLAAPGPDDQDSGRAVAGIDVPTAATAATASPESPGAVARADQAAVVSLPRLRPVTPAGQQYGYLQDASTGQRFTPRGANYVRVTTPGVPGASSSYHSTFEPGRYTTTEAETLMHALERDGYNAVRVFMDQGSVADADTYGLPHGLGRGMSHDGPVVVGEFGASKAFYNNDIVAAAYGMRDMQVDTCQRGMSGWLYWTYNAADTADTAALATIYTYADQRGAINGQLAPIVRPDPCSTH